MASHILRRVGAVVVLFCAVATSVFAQSNKGDIVGTVNDTAGSAVVDASVTALKVDTGATRTVNTDDSGNYQIPLLDIGIYKVTVTKQGFQTTIQENVTLQTQDRQRVDFELPPGTVTGDVTITTGPT